MRKRRGKGVGRGMGLAMAYGGFLKQYTQLVLCEYEGFDTFLLFLCSFLVLIDSLGYFSFWTP